MFNLIFHSFPDVISFQCNKTCLWMCRPVPISHFSFFSMIWPYPFALSSVLCLPLYMLPMQLITAGIYSVLTLISSSHSRAQEINFWITSAAVEVSPAACPPPAFCPLIFTPLCPFGSHGLISIVLTSIGVTLPASLACVRKRTLSSQRLELSWGAELLNRIQKRAHIPYHVVCSPASLKAKT